MSAVLGLVLLVAIGLLMLCQPEFIWDVEHLFTVKNGEPTDFYLAMTRITGAIFVLIPVIIGLVYLMKPILG